MKVNGGSGRGDPRWAMRQRLQRECPRIPTNAAARHYALPQHRDDRHDRKVQKGGPEDSARMQASP